MSKEQLGEGMVGISHSCHVQVTSFSYVTRKGWEGKLRIILS